MTYQLRKMIKKFLVDHLTLSWLICHALDTLPQFSARVTSSPPSQLESLESAIMSGRCL